MSTVSPAPLNGELRVPVVKPREDAPLTKRFFSFGICVSFTQLFEYFDFYTIGFVVALVSGPWHLTFGESAIILLGTGAGTIVGSAFWGWMGDRWGRRPLLIAAIITFSVGTGLSAITPTGWWWLLAIFRIIVGAGSGGANTAGPPLIVEFTPARYRTLQGSLLTVALVPVGGVATSLVMSHFGAAIGFRGLLLIGLAPVLATYWVLKTVPESARWLSDHGRFEEAKASVERIFGPDASVTEEVLDHRSKKDKSYWGMLRKAPRAFWSVVLLWFFMDVVFAGVGLWGPTLLVDVAGTTVSGAATLFIYVTLAGFVGRCFVPFIANRFGRRRAGMLTGLLGGVLLALGGVYHTDSVGSVSAFLLFLVFGYMFADGTFTNLVPFTSEIWPADLRLHGQGLGNAAGGVAKMVGPLVLALFANTSNFVTPEATSSATLPSFAFFGGVIFLVAVVFWLIAPETRGRTLEDINHRPAPGRGGAENEPGFGATRPATAQP
jgi:MFS transporter, putative metabolite:H+ symporter